MIDRQVADVIETSAQKITKANVQSADDARAGSQTLIAYGKPRLKANQQLRRFLYKNLYFHPQGAGANDRECPGE